MPANGCLLLLACAEATLLVLSASGAVRRESFDREPSSWEGVNNRNAHFPKRIVQHDFGYNPESNCTGAGPGEVGGKIYQAGEAAYYGWRLPQAMSIDDQLSVSGKLLVRAGPGHFLLGFFNSSTLNEWRTPNTLAVRINSRGSVFHCHLEYCSARWRAEAGVIGEMVRGERIQAKELPCDRVYEWHLTYDPAGSHGSGVATLRLGDQSASCTIVKEHRQDGASFTHFGLLPVLKTWDSPGEVWISEVTVNGKRFDFRHDPEWEGLNNRRSYETGDTRPRFDFGWSPTQHAGGQAAGEMGGLVFRGDCREPARLGAYGDRLSPLSLDTPLCASGKVSMRRGVSDSTASIGFYHSTHSLKTNVSQNQSVPMDYLGINIEGPSSEGFYFYPVCRPHDHDAIYAPGSSRPPRIYPDGRSRRWSLRYDPEAANGHGRITVTLDDQTCTLDLPLSFRAKGASFDRFGICTPWIDGNSVTVYFDDLEYTCEENWHSARGGRDDQGSGLQQ